jgi:tetratricopeptide (TPR) repeat protein
LQVWGKVLTWQGTFSYYMGRLETAVRLLRQGLNLLDEVEVAGMDTTADQAWALHMLAVTARELGNWEDYESLSEQSLALYRAARDRWGVALLTGGAASIALHSATHDEARSLAEESLALRQEIGDRWGTANVLHILGALSCVQAKFDEAEQLFREGIAIHQEVGHHGVEARVGLLWLTYTLIWRGMINEAYEVAQESLARFDDAGQRFSSDSGFARWRLAEAQRHLGRYEEARIQIQTSQDYCRELNRAAVFAFLRASLGGVVLALESYSEARSLLQESLALSYEIQLTVPDPLAFSLTFLVYAARGLGELGQARGYLRQALQRAADTRNALSLIEVLPAAALVLADGGDSVRSGAERAVELYALASRYPLIASSQWYEDVVGRHIAAVATTLPPDVVAVAQERGRARDLWETVEELLVELEDVSGEDWRSYKQERQS